MLEVGIKSRKPFDSARQRLREAGLLEFENGNGRGCTTKYTLSGFESTPKRGAKNTPLSDTLSGQVSGKIKEGFGKEKGAVHKTKIKSKNIEANASASGGKNSSSKASQKPAPDLEPWAAWLAENAPRVQQMKTPLTAKQWAGLVDTYGEPLVQEVMTAMENTAVLLSKYTSANLTARDWCKRRCPNGVPPKPSASAAPTAEAPELNLEFLAQQQAAAEAKRAARRAELAAAA